ncbi:hypothetical protein ABZ078_26735 [Streptomyces sp. NPDC006385]|uniref:hypothetical protein n=1 Tax=Streptomyces sp. NPDC006385 TaxID=3156761 RepID=UPI0033AB3AC6
MKKQHSEQFAFWVCRRLFGQLTPYDRCFICGDMHIPPTPQHPHNGRYDFTGPRAAVEVVSIVDSGTLRNFSSWNKHHEGNYMGDLEGPPSDFGLTLPWVIGIPATTLVRDYDQVLEAVRSMEYASIYSTTPYDSRNKSHRSHQPGRLHCIFCQVAFTASFSAHVDPEGLIASRPGLAIITVSESIRHALPDIWESIRNLLNPTIQLRSDVMAKLDLAEQHGKQRRVACFVLDDFISMGLWNDELKDTQLMSFDWEAIHPVTDVVVASPWQKRALVFHHDQPARSVYVRGADKPPHPRTVGCP